MTLWRCVNPECSDAADGPPAFDFEAEVGACPRCPHTAKDHPGVVIERACIHYLVNTPAGPMATRNGNRQVACQPLLRRLPKHATGHHSAATCPACLKTPVYLEHAAADVDQNQPIVKEGPRGKSPE